MSVIPRTFSINLQKRQEKEPEPVNYQLLSTKKGTGNTMKYMPSKIIFSSVRLNDNKMIQELKEDVISEEKEL